MPMDIYDVVKRPIVTERTMRTLDETNTYAFEVHPKSNKVQIRNAVEKLFKVKVLAVRTAHVRGKVKWSRTGGRFIRWQEPAWKKAWVRLKEGDAIELF